MSMSMYDHAAGQQVLDGGLLPLPGSIGHVRPHANSLSSSLGWERAAAHPAPAGAANSTGTAHFHEAALLLGVWMLVVFVGVHTASSMRFVIEPLLWAFFLMMGLLPLTDAFERLLLRVGRLVCTPCRGSSTAISGASRRGADRQAKGHNTGPEVASAMDDSEPEDESSKESDDEDGTAERCTPKRFARFVSVLLVSAFLIGFVALFASLIFESADHMQSNWNHYQDGADRISADAAKFISIISKRAPEAVAQDLTGKALSGIEEILKSVIGSVVGHLTSSLAEVLMIILYMIFWLSNPIHVSSEVAVIFKRYILLKGLASALYATCVWLLLYTLSVDLAVVFGFTTFLFNFLPEVGPFLAAVIPVPVILFDGRLPNPWATLGAVLGGTLALKFIFGNIVEVKLIESQQDMKMHPVIILFFVAVFAWMWGATGMLLSVPLVAAAKATMHALPAAYRDPLLVILEGDTKAPKRYNDWYQNRHIRAPGPV